MKKTIRQGDYLKMGALSSPGAVTFTFACSSCEEGAVVLYDRRNGSVREIQVPEEFRIGSLYSVTVEGVSLQDYDYNFRLGERIVPDPYAVSIVGRETWGDPARLSEGFSVRCRRDESPFFDWTGDLRPQLCDQEMVVYKIHVRNFTKRGLAKGKHRGTFAGVADALPYLKDLGATTLELMPVYEFEEVLSFESRMELLDYQAWKEQKPEKERKVRLNAWGYRDADYFAPKRSYAAGNDPEGELKSLIQLLHSQRMECVLEFFFPEGLTGGYIVEALRHWVRQYHVDGFHLLGFSLPMGEILNDPLLSDTKFFYTGFTDEFLTGRRLKNRLFVYNDEYLYPARKMLNRMEMNLDELVRQIVKCHPAEGFVNYITSNNGFTMADLFSYNRKHNEANGEANRDGNDWNYSANYGEEGKSRKRAVTNDRVRQIRNAFALLLLSKGVPLIYEGDEVGNSKDGNNNTWCQDNDTAYVTWGRSKRDQGIREFVQKLLAFRRSHPILTARTVAGRMIRPESGLPEISLHGENAWAVGLDNGRCAVGIFYCGEYADDDMLYVAYNFQDGQQTLALPKLPFPGHWGKVMDTALEGDPFLPAPEKTRDQKVRLPGRSVRIYIGVPEKGGEEETAPDED